MKYPTTLTLTVYGVTFPVYVTIGASRNTYQVKTARGYKTIAKKDCTGIDNTAQILEAIKAGRA
jgi:hypothetical protein